MDEGRSVWPFTHEDRFVNHQREGRHDLERAVLSLGQLLFAWPELETGEDVPPGVMRVYDYLRSRAHPLSDAYAWHRYFNETAQGAD